MVFLCGVAPAAWASRHPDAALCDRAAETAAKATGVPIDILLAISRVESGRRRNGTFSPWPWTIDADGTGTFYDTEADAIAAATAHLTDGTRSFDIGCFQLNIRWHGQAFATFEEMFDPDRNATYAAQFLQRLYAEKGNWADAVSAYHSRSPDLAAAYLSQVKAVIEQPSDAAPGPAVVPVIAVNNFPLLQAGLPGGIGSIVPATTARRPLIGGGD